MQALADRYLTLVEWLSGLPDWQSFLLVVGSSLVFAALLQVGGDVVLKRFTARIPGEVDDIILLNSHTAIWSSVGIAGLYLGTTQLTVEQGFLNSAHATTLSAITLIWAWTLVRTIPEVLEEVTESSYIDHQVGPIVGNILTAIVGAISLFLVLSFWGINITPLLASAGVLGIVAGLAARDAIANFFGSLALYADGTFTVGDFIVLESGERGTVEDISIRSTVIRTLDDVLVTIPNAELNNAAIVNESDPETQRRITLPVGVAYGTELDEVDSILLSVAEAAEGVRDRPTPRVFVREFGDSAVNLDLVCWIEYPRLHERVENRLLRDIYAEFREAGIEIPFPQRSVHVADDADQAPPPVDSSQDGAAATDGGDAED